MTIVLEGLEDSFDNDRAEEMLNLSIGRITHTSDLVRKSLYDFDLETPEGIEKLNALLPIMDPEILKDIMTEIWPGYPTDIDARRHRLEIKGFLKDYLESYDQEDATGELEASGDGNVEPGAGEGGGEAQGSPAGSAPEGEPAQGGNLSMGASSDGSAKRPQVPAKPGTEKQTPVAKTAGA